MAVPVAAYMAVICTMMWRAAARVGSPRTPALPALLGLAGALSFGASDTLLAVSRFAVPFPGARWPVMVLYWLGQCGIAASAVAACAMLREQVSTR
jgi:uncharacterized membrane protein YhhN